MEQLGREAASQGQARLRPEGDGAVAVVGQAGQGRRQIVLRRRVGVRRERPRLRLHGVKCYGSEGRGARSARIQILRGREDHPDGHAQRGPQGLPPREGFGPPASFETLAIAHRFPFAGIVPGGGSRCPSFEFPASHVPQVVARRPGG
jgi:hypothetical protein